MLTASNRKQQQKQAKVLLKFVFVIADILKQEIHAVMHRLLQVSSGGTRMTKAACTDLDMSDPKQVDTN